MDASLLRNPDMPRPDTFDPSDLSVATPSLAAAKQITVNSPDHDEARIVVRDSSNASEKLINRKNFTRAPRASEI
jgi:hypothetical protein